MRIFFCRSSIIKVPHEMCRIMKNILNARSFLWLTVGYYILFFISITIISFKHFVNFILWRPSPLIFHIVFLFYRYRALRNFFLLLKLFIIGSRDSFRAGTIFFSFSLACPPFPFAFIRFSFFFSVGRKYT